jgi:hypothetical protein
VKFFPIYFLFLFLWACDSRNEALFTLPEDTENIQIEARITRSLNEIDAPYRKSDTITPFDTVLLMVHVQPSKAIRIKNYYWTLDTKKKANEFSVKTNFSKSGKHLAIFHLIDFYGDTLKDTLSIWVSKPPVLDTLHYTPAKASKSISDKKGVSFVWSAKDEDPQDHLKHRFRLYTKDTVLVDSMLYTHYFEYQNPLPSLEPIFWMVETFDSFHMKSKNTLQSYFTTQSLSKLGAVFIPFSKNNMDVFSELSVNLIALEGQKLPRLNSPSKTYFYQNDLEKGAYSIAIHNSEYPDYKSDTIYFNIKQEELQFLDTLSLNDTSPPQIHSMQKSNDTLNNDDSLFFKLTENGFPLNKNNIKVFFDSKVYHQWHFYNDSLLYVLVPPEQQKFFWHILSFIIEDHSKNKLNKSFYLSPKP